MKNIYIIIILTLISFTAICQQAEFQWANSFGSAGYDKGNAIAVDANGNVYSTGIFYDTISLNINGTYTNLSSYGSADIYLLKQDASGNFLWLKQIGGTSFDNVDAMAIDASGYLYLTGSFSGTCDFDPDVAVQNRSSVGSSDLYILKLDDNGNYQWIYNAGSISGENGTDITVTDVGDIYAVGHFFNTVDFDPTANDVSLTNNSSSFADIYILHLNTNGVFQWVRQTGGSQADFAYAIEFDTNGNLAVVGGYRGTVDFDPGSGTFDLTSNDRRDIFIQKLNQAGNFMWAVSMGGDENDLAYGVDFDDDGNVYTVGAFEETVDFDTGAGVSNITGIGLEDVFIHKLDSNGVFQWARIMGGQFADFAFDVKITSDDKILTYGFVNGTIDLNTDAGVLNHTSINGPDVFIHELDLNGNFLDAYVFPSDDNCKGNALFVDANGNMYGVGSLDGTMDFDPGTGTYNLTTQGNTDAFVFKLGCAQNKNLVSPTDDYFLNEQTEIRVGNTITASNIIGAGADITFNAGNYIELLAGFEVQQGASFTTLMNGCN